MDPEIISRECIKPYSPTPLHLKTHKLSLLDQLLFHTYFPMIFFYSFNQNKNISDQTDINLVVSERLQLLKNSLSETLTPFYPFAGKFKDNLSVDCNDEGIYFVEARVKSCSLDEYLDNPDVYSIYKFFPFDASEQGESVTGLHVGKIQVTTFACGGHVICACLSHLFGDGKTLSSFLKSWAARACGNSAAVAAAVVPDTDASFLFPQNEELPKEATWLEICAPFYKTGGFVTRRFVFDARAIAKLKEKASSSRVQNPTRVEVVSALFTKRFIDSPALKTKPGDSHKPINLTHSVDLRLKAKPPISENSMGNLVRNAYAMCSDDEDHDLETIVWKLREAVKKIDGDFVKSLQGEKGIVNVCEYARDERKACCNAKERLVFSSWCNFGLYDIDFGWGNPIWVSRVGVFGPIPKFSNTIVFMDTRLRDGIEAWVYLLEEDMKILESHKELLAFATLNPSPLQ